VYLILLGAPGTGKGTQAKILAQQRGLLHLSTGDMLREAVASGTELGRRAKSYMDAGALVPDALVIDMLLERIAKPDAAAGFILDGFPRTLAQARALDEALERTGKGVDIALNFVAPDEELVRRLSNRWICRRCGYIANRRLEKCPACGGGPARGRPRRHGAHPARDAEAAGRHGGALPGRRQAGGNRRHAARRTRDRGRAESHR